MSSYLENLRKQIEDRISMPVRFTKAPAYGMFTATVQPPVLLSAYQMAVSDLPVMRLDFVAPVFLNFYLESGWQQAALRQLLQNGGEAVCTPHFADFEVQYAYDRICNQLELLCALGYEVPAAEDAYLELLTADCEVCLMEQLAMEPDLPEIAKRFHAFFNISPIRGESPEIAGARLALVQACKQVLERY